jgi:hypothetical protein
MTHRHALFIKPETMKQKHAASTLSDGERIGEKPLRTSAPRGTAVADLGKVRARRSENFITN